MRPYLGLLDDVELVDTSALQPVELISFGTCFFSSNLSSNLHSNILIYLANMHKVIDEESRHKRLTAKLTAGACRLPHANNHAQPSQEARRENRQSLYESYHVLPMWQMRQLQLISRADACSTLCIDSHQRIQIMSCFQSYDIIGQ